MCVVLCFVFCRDHAMHVAATRNRSRCVCGVFAHFSCGIAVDLPLHQGRGIGICESCEAGKFKQRGLLQSNWTTRCDECPAATYSTRDVTWTLWFNRDSRSFADSFDDHEGRETLRTPPCRGAQPLSAQCERSDGVPSNLTGQSFRRPCGIDGLVCLHADNVGGCADYRVRYRCPPLLPTNCSACALGRFGDEEGQQHCKPCPQGEFVCVTCGHDVPATDSTHVRTSSYTHSKERLQTKGLQPGSAPTAMATLCRPLQRWGQGESVPRLS